MLYVYAFILILSGVYLMWFGQKQYGLSFAISYLTSAMALYFITVYPNQLSELIPNYPYVWITLGVNVVIALGIFFFSKFFTYLIAWEMIAIPLLIISIKLSGGGSNPMLGLVALVVPIVAVYFLRKIVKKIAIGFFSGLTIATGLLLFILFDKFKTGEIFNEQPTYMLVILLMLLAGGVYFQFSPYANRPADD